MKNLSRIAHDAIWRDKSQSLCARAYEHRGHWLGCLWVRAFGERHCRASWLYHNRRR